MDDYLPGAAMNEATTTTDLADQVRTALEKYPHVMTVQLARSLGVAEADVLRHLPEGRAVELDPARWEELIRSFEALGPVHVIVTNGGATLECVGTFGGFSTWDEFFNVQSETLDMHIRWPRLTAIFAVEKPSHMTGRSTHSFQFYEEQGNAAFKVFLTFGEKEPPPATVELFGTLRDRFRK